MPLDSSHPRLRSLFLIALCLLVSSATFILWLYTRHNLQMTRYNKFMHSAEQVQAVIEKRLDAYRDLLVGVQALYAASKSVERDEFTAFVTKPMQASQPAGFEAVGYAERIAIDRLPQFISEVRLDESLKPGGYPGFKVYPVPKDTEAWVIKYYVNFGFAEKALGFDFRSRNKRRAAIEKARDTGEIVASDAFSHQSTSHHQSVFVVLPVYVNGLPISTTDERRAAFQGAVFAHARYDRLFADVVPPESRRFIKDLTVLDSGGKVFDHDEDFAIETGKGSHFCAMSELRLFHQIWKIRLCADKKFDTGNMLEKELPVYVLLGGVLVNLLVVVSCYLLLTSRSRAVRLAETMTQELRAERDHSTRIIMETPAVICKINPDGTTLFINPAGEKVTGYRSDELLGRNWWQIFYPGDEYRQVEQLFRDFEKGNVRDYEMKLIARDGQPRYIAWNSINLTDETGKLKEIIGFGHDLTGRKLLEDQLRQSQKMEAVGKLAGGVAHEINNPLAVILGFAQGLAKRLPPDDPAATPVYWIEKEAVRCKKLVEDLLTFSRSGKSEKLPLDINSAVEGALALVHTQGKIKNVQIVKKLGADLPRIPANEMQIQQVVVNLANNALDAMPGGGTLLIATENALCRQTPCIRIRIEDTGAGIPADVQPRIFEPFFTTKAVGAGTGLGLSLVYEIVSKHAGDIHLESVPGKGTIFNIDLPTAA